MLYDEKKAIIFGGWDAPKCFDDVYLLDLGKIYKGFYICSSYAKCYTLLDADWLRGIQLFRTAVQLMIFPKQTKWRKTEFKYIA